MASERVIRLVSDHDATARFVILGQEGYSEFWRRDRSPIEPLELAKLLVALRKIGSCIGRTVGTIVWSGMEVENAIALDPTPIMGQYPVPAAKVDLMVGLTVQEALKRVEWSARLADLARQRLQVSAQYQYKFDLFLKLIELVYVDSLSNRSVLGLYTEAARKWSIAENASRLISPPTLSELLHIWWKMAADRKPNTYLNDYREHMVSGPIERETLDRYYKKPIDVLNKVVLPLRECSGVRGLAERVDHRVGLYAALWEELLPFIRFWPGDRGDRTMVPDTCDEDMARDDAEKRAVNATIVSYSQLIERAIPNKSHDFTDELKNSVQDPDNVVPIEGADIVMVAQDKIDRVLLRRLQQVMRSAAERRNIYNRGLPSGKIHARRLYRAPTTGLVFQEKQHQFVLRSDIILLTDATGSMADPTKWDKAETVYQTLFQAILGFNKNARLFAYNEVKNTCRITELYRGGKMLTVLPHGKTASGEAIIATAITTRGHSRKRLLIHVTDGASNWGCGVEEAITYCNKAGIRLLTLGIGCSPSAKQSLRAEYRDLVAFVDDTDALPQLMNTLLNRDKRG